MAIKSYGAGELSVRSRQISQEAEVLSMLASSKSRKERYVCNLVDQMKEGDILHLILSPKLGGPLHKHMIQGQKGHLATTVARGYASEIVCALRFIHSEWCVHRDLKASNVLLDQFGHVSLCDFGSAKLLLLGDGRGAEPEAQFDVIGNMIPTLRERGPMSCQHDDLPRSYTLTGTPEYMSPEMFVSTGASISGHSFAADWWAFGVLLYELLTGHPPPWRSRAIKQEGVIRADDAQSWDWDFSALPSSISEGWSAEDGRLGDLGLDLVSSLLDVHANDRWENAKKVTGHAFFEAVDWKELEMGRHSAPCPDFDSRLGFLDLLELGVEGGQTGEGVKASDELTAEQQALFSGY